MHYNQIIKNKENKRKKNKNNNNLLLNYKRIYNNNHHLIQKYHNKLEPSIEIKMELLGNIHKQNKNKLSKNKYCKDQVNGKKE